MKSTDLTTHSVMFHHFHDDHKHPKGQGAISRRDFSEIINYLDNEFSLISASDYINLFLNNEINNEHICLSFDDALKCQLDIAIPVLEERNLDAFFFIYTSPLMGEPDFLEVYRYFRTVKYSDISLFYKDFFNSLEQQYQSLFQKSKEEFDEESYLSDFPFYSFDDKYFRYVRDNILDNSQYHKIMHCLFEKHSFDINKSTNDLWMTPEEIKSISDKGHVIGLHSHSHPTQLHKLTKEEQRIEYNTNYKFLTNIIKKDIISMSHPCGNYNSDTLDILEDLGIKIGFRSNLGVKHINSPLEIPREDHTNIISQIDR